MPNSRKNFRERRHMIRTAQRNRCSICGQIFGSEPCTLDHVIPRALGGRHLGNMLVAHRHCNTRRGSAKPTGCMLILLAAVNARLGIAA